MHIPCSLAQLPMHWPVSRCARITFNAGPPLTLESAQLQLAWGVLTNEDSWVLGARKTSELAPAATDMMSSKAMVMILFTVFSYKSHRPRGAVSYPTPPQTSEQQEEARPRLGALSRHAATGFRRAQRATPIDPTHPTALTACRLTMFLSPEST